MESKSGLSGGAEPKLVSLEEFIIANWQILTILGVFIGFTNYVHTAENAGLLILSFLLTFIVLLEIMQLLLRIRNKSLLLKAFTLLTAAFIFIFAGYIYMNFFADAVSASLAPAVRPLGDNIVPVSAAVVLVAASVAAAFIFKSRLYPALGGVGARQRRLGVTAAAVLLAALAVSGIGVWLAQPAPEAPPPAAAAPEQVASTLPSTTTSTATVSTEASTSTTLVLAAAVECSSNAECGNQSGRRICYQGDVYIQESRPLCQHPGTPDAKCVVKTSLAGESLTQEANPLERCSRGCSDGVCK
jgi:hypothetical protein